MTGGSLPAVPALLASATAPSVPVSVLAWITAGAAMAAVLYNPRSRPSPPPPSSTASTGDTPTSS